MGADSKIEWCDHTFNPWWGCAKVAAGCANCYAETQSKRYGHAVWGKDAPRRLMSDAHWAQPLKWAKDETDEAGDEWDREESARIEAKWGGAWRPERPRVFCGSMCDVFEDRADLVGTRSRLMRVIHETPELDWLLLTKRPENVLRLCPMWGDPEPMRNVWLGTSVACQADADRNVPLLPNVPARVRFLSVEPLVGPVDLSRWFPDGCRMCNHPGPVAFVRELCSTCGGTGQERGIDWVIVGGESGPKARPCDVEWIRSIVSQCREAGVPCFIKQVGAKPYTDQRTRPAGEDWTWTSMLRDRKGGDPSEWPEDLRVREFPVVSND